MYAGTRLLILLPPAKQGVEMPLIRQPARGNAEMLLAMRWQRVVTTLEHVPRRRAVLADEVIEATVGLSGSLEPLNSVAGRKTKSSL